jgi:O-methyltransferase
MKKCVTRFSFPERYAPIRTTRAFPVRLAVRFCQSLLALRRLELVHKTNFDPPAREEGLDAPAEAETMIGLKRLNNLESCVIDVICRRVPGDLIETGVWRGGASIFMRAVLKAYDETDRTVWVADSFQGVPRPNPTLYPADAGEVFWKMPHLVVPLELLDSQVRFLAGWFRDTLPRAPIDRLAVLRLDGDLYESTMDSLTNLYPKLSRGGYVIIDDYTLPTCRTAVDDYRSRNRITEPIVPIDHYGSYWQRLD